MKIRWLVHCDVLSWVFEDEADAQSFAHLLPAEGHVRPVGYYEKGSVPRRRKVMTEEENPTFVIGWSHPDECYVATIEGAPPYVKAAGKSAEEAIVNLKREIRLRNYIEKAWKER